MELVVVVLRCPNWSAIHNKAKVCIPQYTSQYRFPPKMSCEVYCDAYFVTIQGVYCDASQYNLSCLTENPSYCFQSNNRLKKKFNRLKKNFFFFLQSRKSGVVEIIHFFIQYFKFVEYKQKQKPL